MYYKLSDVNILCSFIWVVTRLRFCVLCSFCIFRLILRYSSMCCIWSPVSVRVLSNKELSVNFRFLLKDLMVELGMAVFFNMWCPVLFFFCFLHYFLDLGCCSHGTHLPKGNFWRFCTTWFLNAIALGNMDKQIHSMLVNVLFSVLYGFWPLVSTDFLW